jgi:(R,R)-butanediol dehydrogenase/meso-butanediol dehydrogenase/diacetyl reductase
MKAARFYDRGDIRIEDIPEPKVLPGTVGIQVAWCGICGTDLHEFMEGPILFHLVVTHTQFRENLHL